MRPERLYLQDIVEACDLIAAFTAGRSEAEFVGSELHKAAVLQKLAVIGEAAARLPSSFRAAHPTVEWRAMAGFRNIAVHAYFSVQWPIVWATATHDVPVVRLQVLDILGRLASTSV